MTVTTPPTATTTPLTPDVTLTPSALAACVGDVETFRREALGSQPHRFRPPADLQDRLRGVFALTDADAALTGYGLRRPALRLIVDGNPVPANEWTTTARTGSYQISDLVDAPRALGALADGTTVVFQSLQRWWPPVIALCRELELEFGHPVQANAYLTPPGSAGLTPHHDTHDVFVIQTYGTKAWTVRTPLIEAPLKQHSSNHAEAARQPVIDTFEMQVGDCLYLPRGWIHSAAAQQQMSLHVTVGVLERTAVDVLENELRRATAEIVELRRPVAAGEAQRGPARAALTAAIDALRQHLADLDVETLLDSNDTRFQRRRRRATGGQLLDLAGLGALDDASVVAVIDPAAWSLDAAPVDAAAPQLAEPQLSHPQPVVLSDGHQQIRLPAVLGPVIARILAAGAFSVGSLSDSLDAESRLVLIRRLIREGVVGFVDPPSSSTQPEPS